MKPWRITVLGGGAWGTALTAAVCRSGQRVVQWARDPETASALSDGRNPRYLPGISLPSGISATSDAAHALDGTDCVLVVVPAQSLRESLDSLAFRIPPHVPVILCAKGIERTTGLLLSDVAREHLQGNPLAALSGPSFATDVARGLPTAVVVAAEEESLAAMLALRFSSETFRCYSTDDLTGVEIGGALKNVFAIAAGAVTGANLGASAQAAMVTRGFVELRRIGAAFGARPETFMGLSGLGDLMLTCSTVQSRNFAYGLALGRGEDLDNLPLAEGVATAGIAARIAMDHGVDAPIINAVSQLVDRRITIQEAVQQLMNRPLKTESE
ncbi:MAG: NAD(P)H-dependent glycerol-3-phosphate dehydrogenase [Rhizobiaceae bacterium]|nr:NAD(P)H-dependent glycerol-3-phosphate dehydrogenase [Rhizobiaceae bacterium]